MMATPVPLDARRGRKVTRLFSGKNRPPRGGETRPGGGAQQSVVGLRRNVQPPPPLAPPGRALAITPPLL
jgi:hypothetical protein